MKNFRKVLNVLSTVLLLAATAVVVFVFVLRINGAKPKMFGYYVFNVASDSMTPMLDFSTWNSSAAMQVAATQAKLAVFLSLFVV